MLGGGFDQAAFGVGGGLVFGVEALDEGLVLLSVFATEESEVAGEAVADAVLGDDGFALPG